jgi:glycosyltransferase involved in cell wall biosynthesis
MISRRSFVSQLDIPTGPGGMANAIPRAEDVTEGNNTEGNKSSAGVRICLVGPGWRFTSGISYYTCRLAGAAAESHDVTVIQLRQLLPRFLYPGKRRVGQPRARVAYPPGVPVFDGIDWWWGLSVLRAMSFLRAHRAKVLVLQWWTATTVHTYVALSIVARLLGALVVIEVHELQDPGEATFAIARHYGRWGLRALLRLCHGCVVHSKADRRSLEEGYRPANLRIAMAAHGPYDQFRTGGATDGVATAAVEAVRQAPRPLVANLLFFGLIRPYKGLTDLLAVFNSLTAEEASGLWLTVVGETWDGCIEPAHLIETSPHRDRITFVNEYVSDEVVAAAFGHADVVVLPYRRSSSSGTLHVAMSWGLPVVVTSVGGLPEAASGYEGAIFVPPGDPAMLKTAIMRSAQMRGRRFTDPRNWNETVDAILSAGGQGGQ